MAYCGTETVNYLAQVSRDEVGFTTEAAMWGWVNGTLIPMAENFIDNYCGGRSGTLRRFNLCYGSLRLDGNGKETLFLPPKYTPWNYLGTLTIDGGAVTASNIKLHDQFLDYDGGAYTEGKQNVLVIGTHGYSSVPDAVEFICAQLCANILLDMKRRNRAEVSVSQGGLTRGGLLENPALLNAPWVLTAPLKEQLDKYRITWVDLG